MRKIHKINNLIHEQSFLQINYEHNFSTLDHKGHIIDIFSKNNRLLNIEETDGIILQFNNKEIKISSNSFWIHSNNLDGLDLFANDYWSEFKKLKNMTEIKLITRIGWRNYFVYEFENKEKRDKCFGELFPDTDSIQPKSIEFFIEKNEITNNFFVKKVSKIKNDTPGILFDIDSFKTFNNGIDVNNVKMEIKKIRENIQSASILDGINLFIK